MPAPYYRPLTQPQEFLEFVTVDGLGAELVFPLSDLGVRAVLTSDGWGMSGTEFRSERGPFQDGETPLNMVYKPRIIQLVFRHQGHSRENYWDNREYLLNILRPNRSVFSAPSHLRIIRPDGTKRQLDVFLQEGPTFAQRGGSWDEWSFSEAIRLIAFDPFFYDPDQVLHNFPVDPCTGLEFPFHFPIHFCGVLIYDTQKTVYTGTAPSFPKIYVTGPITDFYIANDGFAQQWIKLKRAVPAGRTVTFDLHPRKKTVMDDLGANWIGSVEGYLTNFQIIPEPKANNGLNIIKVTGTGAIADVTQVSLSYYTRYLGV